MTKLQTVSWGGIDFVSYDLSQTRWKDVPGVYIFAGTSLDGQWWQAIYIGQTSSLRNRLGNGIESHERWEDVVRHGVTHVHAKVVRREIDRRSLESMLIDSYNPPMNAT